MKSNSELNKSTSILVNTQSLEKHEDKVWYVSWHPTEDIFASCGSDKKIIIWKGENISSNISASSNINNSANTSQYSAQAVLEESQSRTIRSVAWDYSGNYLASASFDSTINIWKRKVDSEGKTEYECIALLEGHENEVKSVSWSVSGKYLASCSRDKTIWIWDVDEDNDFSCNNVIQGHTQDVKMVKWHPKEDVLFSCSYDDLIKVWQFDENQDDWVALNSLKGHGSTVWAINFSKDGRFFVSCSNDKSLIIWSIEKADYKNIKLLSKVEGVHSRGIYSVSFSFDDSFLATASADNSIAIFSVNKTLTSDCQVESIELKLMEKVESAHDEDVNCVAWQRKDKNTLVSCGDDSLIKVWSIQKL